MYTGGGNLVFRDDFTTLVDFDMVFVPVMVLAISFSTNWY